MSLFESENAGLVISIEGHQVEGAGADSECTSLRVKNYLQSIWKSSISKKTLERRLPILKWGRTYDLACLQGDVLAGLTVGLTAIPQGLAYAVVSGVDPIYGLYSGFIGCFVYMIFGSCKDITIGPTAIMSIMAHEYVASVPCHTETVMVLLAFLTGCFILLASILRIGFLITFVGRPIISGFTSAAAITIASSQVKGLLGLKFDAEGFINTWYTIFLNIGKTKYQDAILGISCIIILLAMKWMYNLKVVAPQPGDATWPRVWKKIIFLLSVGRNAVVVIVCCAIAYFFRENEPFGITGNITAGFPEVGPPEFSLTCNGTSDDGNGTVTYNFLEISSMLGTGLFIIPLIAILEDIAIASAFSDGKTIDATQEMLALGLCNFVGAFFQSIPTTGSFSRTAVNSTSGVKTQAGGVTTGLIVIMALLFLTPVFEYIPKSTLSAVIIVAVIFSVEYHDIMPIWRTFKWDQIPLWTTFLVCLFWALEWGILVGVGVHLCMLLYFQATPRIDVTLYQQDNDLGSLGLVVIQPGLGLMFPSANQVKERISNTGIEHMPLLVVLDCSHVAVVDYTSAIAIKNVSAEFRLRQQRVAFANMSDRVRQSLQALLPSLEEVTLPSLPADVTTNGDVPLLLDGNNPSPALSHGNNSPAPLIGKQHDVAFQNSDLTEALLLRPKDSRTQDGPHDGSMLLKPWASSIEDNLPSSELKTPTTTVWTPKEPEVIPESMMPKVLETVQNFDETLAGRKQRSNSKGNVIVEEISKNIDEDQEAAETVKPLLGFNFPLRKTLILSSL